MKHTVADMHSVSRRTSMRPINTLTWPDLAVQIPMSAHTLEGFRAWATSLDFPEKGRFSYLQGEIYIDMSPERLESHGLVKNEVATVITAMSKKTRRGVFLPDRTLVSNVSADLSTEPDGAFIKKTTLKSGSVRFVYTDSEPKDVKEIVGTPDWVMEVISPGSEKKDDRLRAIYHKAGVPELWLIDARGSKVIFSILIHQSGSYQMAIQKNGWQRSPVFGRWFRLRRRKGLLDLWEYHLDVKKA